MPTDDDSNALVRMLARYLREFPLASDTPEGIARWWLDADLKVKEAALMQALEWMEQRKLIERVHAADGRVRFRRTDNEDGFDARVEALLLEQQRSIGDEPHLNA